MSRLAQWVAQWVSKCGPPTRSISLTWELRNAGCWAPPGTYGSGTLEVGPVVCAVTSPPSGSGARCPLIVQMRDGKAGRGLFCSHTGFEAELEI